MSFSAPYDFHDLSKTPSNNEDMYDSGFLNVVESESCAYVPNDLVLTEHNLAGPSEASGRDKFGIDQQVIDELEVQTQRRRSFSSSLVVLTPPPADRSSKPGSGSSGDGGVISGGPVPFLQSYQDAVQFYGGPCSNTWNLTHWRPRKSKKDPTPRAITRKRSPGDDEGRRKRGKFDDLTQRETTALTRQMKACVKCRMQKIRCDPDPDDLLGPCLTCKRVSEPTKSSLNCQRYIITDASLYREQERPYHMWSKRWKSMDLVDIQDWAADEIKTITISQIFLDAPYDVKVRKFIPQEGDMVEDAYFQNGRLKKYQIPQYALADLEKTASMLEEFVDRNIAVYINAVVNQEPNDDLLFETYLMAFRHYGNAKTQKERELLLDTFRLWVACRKTSNPHHLCGYDKLGAIAVHDPGSTFHGVVPMPVIMIAQMELIMFSRILRPKSKQVLDILNNLVLEQDPCYWYTIYLCCFIIFHSCAMLTRRNEETARQYNLKERFKNGPSIQALHSGAQTILAHWHYVNKGSVPFEDALTSEGLRKVRDFAELTEQQANFIARSARRVREKHALFQEVREMVAFGNDWYWISQMYEKNWTPGVTASAY